MKLALLPFALGLALGSAANWLLTTSVPLSASDLLATRRSLPATASALSPPVPYAVRVNALRRLIGSLPADDFPRLLSTLAAPTDEAGRHLRQIAFDAWVGLDPAAASAWAAGGGKQLRDLALQSIHAWAALDAPAASVWACDLSSDETAAELATVALVALARQDSNLAVALADSHGDGIRHTALPAVFAALSAIDPGATVLAFAPAFWRKYDGWYLSEPMSAWARRDPHTAIGWLISQTAKDPDQASLSYRVNTLAANPAERRAIANAFAARAEIPKCRNALAYVFFHWGISQPAEALAWLDQLGDPDLRLNVLEMSSDHYHIDEIPEQRLPLVLALPVSQNRTESLTRHLTQWARRDPAAARAWLEKSTALTPAEAAALLATP